MNMNNNKACNITTTIRNPCNTYVTLSTEVNVKGPYRIEAALHVLRRLARARTLCARAFAQEPWWQLGGLLVS